MAEFKFKDGSTVEISLGEDCYNVHLHKEDDGTLKMSTYTDFKLLCEDIGRTFFHTPYVDEFPILSECLKKIHPNPKYPKRYILTTLRLAALNISCYN